MESSSPFAPTIEQPNGRHTRLPFFFPFEVFPNQWHNRYAMGHSTLDVLLVGAEELENLGTRYLAAVLRQHGCTVEIAPFSAADEMDAVVERARGADVSRSARADHAAIKSPRNVARTVIGRVVHDDDSAGGSDEARSDSKHAARVRAPLRVGMTTEMRGQFI